MWEVNRNRREDERVNLNGEKDDGTERGLVWFGKSQPSINAMT